MVAANLWLVDNMKNYTERTKICNTACIPFGMPRSVEKPRIALALHSIKNAPKEEIKYYVGHIQRHRHHKYQKSVKISPIRVICMLIMTGFFFAR